MTFETAFTVLYGASVVFALRNTYREAKKSGRRHSIYVFFGYFCCIVWPLAIAAILLTPNYRATGRVAVK